jgi:hypothetical protein
MYQLLLECWPTDNIEHWLFKQLTITTLLEAFVSRAQTITRTIIDELTQPLTLKTYKPIDNIYGYAGGEKVDEYIPL